MIEDSHEDSARYYVREGQLQAAEVYATLAVAQAIDNLTSALTEVIDPAIPLHVEGGQIDQVALNAAVQAAAEHARPRLRVIGGGSPACTWCGHLVDEHSQTSGVCGWENCACTHVETVGGAE